MEKQVVSDRAICGAYYFRSAGVFLEAAARYLHKSRYEEFFVSGVYDERSKRAFFDYCGVENYEERICDGDFFDERVLDILLVRT